MGWNACWGHCSQGAIERLDGGSFLVDFFTQEGNFFTGKLELLLGLLEGLESGARHPPSSAPMRWLQ